MIGPCILERRGSGALLLLNRPDRLNALGRDVVAGVRSALAELRAEPTARALVISGSGERSFCTGADLREREGMTPDEARAAVQTLRALMDEVASFPRPVIAAINGFAFGGGLELALACDIRLASEQATLGLTEVRLAIIPGAGGTQRLSRIVGPARAKELILTGKRIDAQRALAIGLVSEVVPGAQLLDRAAEWAEEIALGGPVALEAAKAAIDGGFDLPLAEGLQVEADCYARVLPTQDRIEALAAFREKRPPRFGGR